MTVRQVRTNGQIKWKGDMIYLSEALRGEPVGLVPQDDRFWTIWFGPLSIGLLDDHNRSVLHTPTKVFPMSLVAQRGLFPTLVHPIFREMTDVYQVSRPSLSTTLLISARVTSSGGTDG